MKLDLHVHSHYSSDCKTPLDQIVMVAKAKGLDGVAVTDHNEIAGSLRLYDMMRDVEGFFILRGVEISSTAGHILAYGVTENVPSGRSPEETLELIRDLGGTVVAAHPYRIWSGIGEDVVKRLRFDAVETLNARTLKRGNDDADALAAEIGAGRTGGSDAHYLHEVGEAYTIFEDGISEDDFIDQIEKGRTVVGGRSRRISASPKYVAKCVSQWIGRGLRRI